MLSGPSARILAGLLPLLLAIGTVPDIFRTLGNVTADLAVLRIVGARGSVATSPRGDDRLARDRR